MAACAEACADAGLDSMANLARVGVAVGVSISYLHHGYLREAWRWRDPAGRLDLAASLARANVPAWHYHRRQGHLVASTAAAHWKCGGPQVAIDTACAASLHALADACRVIWRGRADAMIVGGASGLVSPLTLAAFGRIGALSPQRDPGSASRPFDRRRDGFVLGEGGGALVVERADLALRRGARLHALVLGTCATTNATSLTDPSPGGEAEARAMLGALSDAGTLPSDVDYVAAHGTSTPKNDASETAAIKTVFGPHARRLCVSSNKGQLGHTISSAGIFNVIAAARAIQDGIVPPTANYAEPDPACDLDYVPVARRRDLRVAIANAFAFGGQNASVVLCAPA
jgi:3-oxoacyl-[acyl-carrier-protein] synthase II